MSRYIEQERIGKTISNLPTGVFQTENRIELVLSATEVINAIKEAPSINIEPKRGEWIKEKRVYGISKPFCSWCGAVALSEMINLGSYKTCESNFCPNCGAHMKGENDE